MASFNLAGDDRLRLPIEYLEVVGRMPG